MKDFDPRKSPALIHDLMAMALEGPVPARVNNINHQEEYKCRRCSKIIYTLRAYEQHINAHRSDLFGPSAPTSDVDYNNW